MLELTLIQKISVLALPIVFAVTLHEVAHGWVALLCGDHTARLSGRLSLNPLKHVDWVGTVFLPLLLLMTTHFMFGWAKPVPIDTRNLSHPRRDMAYIALAGPFANIVMAFLWGLVAKLGMMNFFSWAAISVPIIYMGKAGIIINVMLAAFNLVPLPLLDGGKVLSCLLPPRIAYYFDKIEPYSFLIMVFLLFSGILSSFMQPFITTILEIINQLLDRIACQ